MRRGCKARGVSSPARFSKPDLWHSAFPFYVASRVIIIST